MFDSFELCKSQVRVGHFAVFYHPLAAVVAVSFTVASHVGKGNRALPFFESGV
jgi:hypothetical protein